jgi:NAD(P)-dependent dehydrogenase (short-subunit alcohol dehydrogenase family)
MAGRLEGKVAIVTGSGRGIGRGEALLLAEEGCRVVVNDIGGSPAGEGADQSPADEVVSAIKKMGGDAVANYDNVASMEGGERMVKAALDHFGRLDILVNNAGILRDRMIFNMAEEEWDAVIAVHLKGHFAPTRWAAAYWREQHKAGVDKPRNLVHTSSTSGLFSNPGQANYGAAKSGIATFSYIASLELGRYGVRSNAIAPAARTRLTEQTPGLQDAVKAPEDESKFDVWGPANVSPFVGYLATEDCPFSGEAFLVQGGVVQRFQSWKLSEKIDKGDRWTVEELEKEALKRQPPEK